MKTIKVERRVPFGFRGDWGKVYKRYTNSEDLKIDDRKICFESNYYVAIDDEIQIKQVGDITSANEQTLNGLEMRTYYMTIETTDSYWNDDLKEYSCCVSPEDILFAFNRFWMVSDVKEVPKFRPQKVSFYYCELKSMKGPQNV